jgi:guanosine-3',5'-bis(diphosphate) 3'-pyrophosphohydrolase
MRSFDAMAAARSIHAQQRRKYTNTPYTNHLAEVAAIACTVVWEPDRDLVISISWLHDSIEDQGVTPEWISETFGAEVAQGVLLLSDLEQGNRATRKALARERLATAPRYIQNIKVADLISNTASIIEHDPKFAVLYCQEAKLLLDSLEKADRRLVKLCMDQLP